MMKVKTLKFLILVIAFFMSGCSRSGKRDNNSSSKQNVKVENQSINNKITETESLEDLYERTKSSVFLVYTSDGEEYHQGSEFLISEDGLCSSNYHVFAGTKKGQEIIKTLDGAEFKISEVLESNKDLDFIVFRIATVNGQRFPFLNITTDRAKIGENVFAIGNPKGLESTLSTGIISAFRDNDTLIQTTTEITHGSSGGPLFNMKGDVIGITSSGLGEANLNFAINILAVDLTK